MNAELDNDALREEAARQAAAMDGTGAQPEERVLPDGVTVADFYSYMPLRKFIFTPTRELWPGASVAAHCPPPTGSDGNVIMRTVKVKEEFKEVPMPPVAWLDEFRAVEQMTWAPGMPMVINDRLVAEGGWIDRPGCSCFNLYLPPLSIPGDPAQADPWIEHVQKVFGDHTDHIIHWLAYRVQHPDIKINHALVLGGKQGIGKDTLLEPIKHAVGPWNFAEVNVGQLMGRFNAFLRSIVLRVSEARDAGDQGARVDRYQVYEHMKTMIASPPDVLLCDEKHLREHKVMNCTGVIITTNHKADGIYLPADDRRHHVSWSDLDKADFPPEYWSRIWRWYLSDGGIGHVVAYLRALNLADFDPKAPPPKTEAWHEIVNASRSPEDAELADALEALAAARIENNPFKEPAKQEPVPVDALTIEEISFHATDSFKAWLAERVNIRRIPHRLETAGFVPVRNPDQTTGRWWVGGKNVVIYAGQALSERDRRSAATALCIRRGIRK